MKGRTRDTIHWPGIDADIHNTRYTFKSCNEMAPSQPKDPLIPHHHLTRFNLSVATTSQLVVVILLGSCKSLHRLVNALLIQK